MFAKTALAICIAMMSLAVQAGSISPPNQPPVPGPQPPAPAPIPPPPQNPNGETITFNAFLVVTQCTDNGACLSNAQPLPNGNVTVNLEPDPSSPYQLRGYYITLAESNGVRYIGIITVNEYEMGTGDGNGTGIQKTYAFTVEILSDKGNIAHMDATFSDPNQLPSVTLTAPGKTVGNITYTPYFSIGPAGPSPFQPEPNRNINWHLEKGSLL